MAQPIKHCVTFKFRKLVHNIYSMFLYSISPRMASLVSAENVSGAISDLTKWFSLSDTFRSRTFFIIRVPTLLIFLRTDRYQIDLSLFL